MYSMRLIYYVFFNQQASFFKTQYASIHEAPLFMLIPMALLAFLSIFFGNRFQSILTSPLSCIFWSDSIVTPIMSVLTEYENIHPVIKLMPSLAIYYGLFIGFFIYQTPRYSLNNFYYSFKMLSKQKFYFDKIYNLIFSKFTVFFGYNVQYKLIDRGLLELIGPSGFYATVKSLAIKFRNFHNGYLIHYLLIILYFLLFFLILGF